MERPLSGYGYGSLWFPTDATIWIQQSLTDFTWVVYHAHNGFLQVASEIGLPLSILALLMILQQMIEIFYCQYQRQQPGVLFVLAFFIAYLAGNFSEGGASWSRASCTGCSSSRCRSACFGRSTSLRRRARG